MCCPARSKRIMKWRACCAPAIGYHRSAATAL
jgi:hypothetical protein